MRCHNTGHFNFALTENLLWLTFVLFCARQTLGVDHCVAGVDPFHFWVLSCCIHAIAGSPHRSTRESSFRVVPAGFLRPCSHWLTEVVVTFR